MAASIPERLRALRAVLREHPVDGFLVPSSDEFSNEYVPLWRQRRAWVSGFDGSAGDLLVEAEAAWLFVDSRYHLQADAQLAGTGITPVKVGTPEGKALGAWLAQRLQERGSYRLGLDPFVVSEDLARRLEGVLHQGGGKLVEIVPNPVDEVWRERPKAPRTPLQALPIEWTGCPVAHKVQLLRQDLASEGATALVTNKLDQIAWLLNLRSGEDVPHNPVFEAGLIVTPQDVQLFLNGEAARLPEGWSERPPGLVLHPLEDFRGAVARLEGRVHLDQGGVTRGICSATAHAGCTRIWGLSPIERRKARKGEAEAEAMRRANLRASVAKTRAWLWLRREVAAGRTVTEAGFRDRIEALYREQEGFFDLSFETISATGEHGAIVHYSACDDTPLRPGELFLVDSGAHIAGGTTDDTRTFAVGSVDDEKRRAYTAVLKGHVNAARQRLPEGVTGLALDALARAPLWEEGFTYGHGTGHGVGAFLNVHEGPFSLSDRPRGVHGALPLESGCVTSIEPGYYRAGWGGIRLENLYLVVEEESVSREEGTPGWLRLEALTWVPFDPDLLDATRLGEAERAWLAAYHEGCRARLLPALPADEAAELQALLARLP